jgi:glycosyltransferase involved in cell wall biosynthesis
VTENKEANIKKSLSNTNETLSLSVLIPAYNEIENILSTLENVTKSFFGLDIIYEIIVIDDGSMDGTGNLVEENQKHYSKVKLLRNDKNQGFGYSYNKGIKNAQMEYSVMVHGDNAWGYKTLNDFFSYLGEANVIIGYTNQMWKTRHWTRTIISKSFTKLMNLLFNRNIKYYNGLQIHKTIILKNIKIISQGYAFQPEVLLKGLQGNQSYIEVGMDLIERKEGESKAFKIKNIVEVFITLWRLFRDLRLK